jgi:CRISPR-associated protein Cas2
MLMSGVMNMAVKIFLLVAYDIAANRRRNRLVKLLGAYGERVNLSVFECRLGRSEYDGLRRKVTALINSRRDSVLFYELCCNCELKMVKLGAGRRSERPGVVIV